MHTCPSDTSRRHDSLTNEHSMSCSPLAQCACMDSGLNSRSRFTRGLGGCLPPNSAQCQQQALRKHRLDRNPRLSVFWHAHQQR